MNICKFMFILSFVSPYVRFVLPDSITQLKLPNLSLVTLCKLLTDHPLLHVYYILFTYTFCNALFCKLFYILFDKNRLAVQIDCIVLK